MIWIHPLHAITAAAISALLASVPRLATGQAIVGADSGDTVAVSLEEATQRALSVSPGVATAAGEVRRPRGLRAEAFWPFSENPTLEYGRVRRRSALATSYDREWAITQPIEIAGQWAVRRSAASALVRSAEANVTDARRIAALEARQVYLTLALAERRFALTDSVAAFAERLAQFARRQFDAGEINRLELNAAILEAARARSFADRATAETQTAAADLGRLLALPADTTVRSTPLPSIPSLSWNSDTALLAIALERRPDLVASRELRRSADRSVALSRLSIVPNLTLAAVGGREEGTDDLFGVVLGVQIPLFYRQQAAGGAAQADLIAAQSRQAATHRAIQAEIQAASAGFLRARMAERRFAREVLGAATANVTLTERALSEGEVDLTDVIVLRRSAVDAQLEYLEVLSDAYGAWFRFAGALAVEPLELATVLGPSEK